MARRCGSRSAARDPRAAARADIPGRRHLRGHTMITKFDSSYYGTSTWRIWGTPAPRSTSAAIRKRNWAARCTRSSSTPSAWMSAATTRSGGPSTISSRKARSFPNLLMMAMHLCGVTKNLRIGCGFNVVPMWHPLRLAEDYAMADILTGGRVIFGVARGYHTREVETFGAPLRDQKANRELFEEGVDILFKAFEGKPFSHKGKYYTIPPKVPYR